MARVRWQDLRDAQGAPADGVPALLSRIAYGDGNTASLAVDDVRDAVRARRVGEAALAATSQPGCSR